MNTAISKFAIGIAFLLIPIAIVDITPPNSPASIMRSISPSANSSININTQPFQEIVGLPPAPATPEFESWLSTLISYRQSESARLRKKPVTYHFAANGNDLNSGSPLAPKRTIGEAQRLLDEAPEGAFMRLSFRRGHTWYTETGLFVDKRFVTVDSYGFDNSKPIFNRFTLAYDQGWEAVPELPGVYRRTEMNIVGWLYDEAIGWETPFFRASNPVNLLLMPSECSGSFYYSPEDMQLYVYLGGDDPNLTTIRGLPANDDIGCRLNKHGGRLDGIVFLGFGLNPDSTSNQASGIKVTAHGDAACLVVDSESYYCSSHACHFNAGNQTLSSGIATFIRCSAGFCQNNGTAGETIFNSYVYQGNQETIFTDCEARFGTLPDDTWYSPGRFELRGTACFGHTAIGVSRLYVSHRMNIAGGPFGCARGTRFADSPAALNLGAIRAFVIEEHFDQARPGAQIDIGGADTARVDCFYRGVLGDHGFRSWSNNQNLRAWVFNCHFDIDASAIGPGYVGFYNSPSVHSMNVEHSDFVFRLQSGHRLRFPDYRLTNSVATNWHNCVFGIIGGPRSIDAGYGAALLDNNGYFGTERNFGNDQLAIEILNELEISSDFIPESGDACFAAGTTSWFLVSSDRQGFLRNEPPSLGDLEHEPPQ